jgi:hypothetical protein
MSSVRDMLKQLSNRQKQRMLQQKANKYVLNDKDMFVQRMVNIFHNQPGQVLCYPCFQAAKKKFHWDILTNAQTSPKELKEILRNIVKKGSKQDVVNFCELLSPHISNRSRKIPRHIRNIWIVFPVIAKKLFQSQTGKSYVLDWMDRWMPYLLPTNGFLQSQIGNSIAVSIFSIDEKSFSTRLFSILFASDINLFRFFRINSENHVNHTIITYLLANDPPHSISDISRTSTLQGLISGGNTSQIEEILHNLSGFTGNFQQLILKEIFAFGYRRNFSRVLASLKDQLSEIHDLKINEELFTLFSNLEEKFQQSQQNSTDLLEKHDLLLQEEKTRIQGLYREWRQKKGPSPHKMSDISAKLIQHSYNPIIQQHIDMFRSEFETFFGHHSNPVIAFDNEEWNNRVFCILGLVINPDLTFAIKLISVEDIYPINNSHQKLMDQMSAWLKTFSSSQVISHGTNKAEEQIIKDGGHFQINTQDILHNAKYFNVGYAHNLTGEGLKHFEKAFKFHREGCPMLKHEMTGGTFFNLAEVSLDHLLSDTPLPVCQMCQKKQDVLLYCLEDAFASLLIYILFSNKDPQLCEELGYNLLN